MVHFSTTPNTPKPLLVKSNLPEYTDETNPFEYEIEFAWWRYIQVQRYFGQKSTFFIKNKKFCQNSAETLQKQKYLSKV